MMQLLLTTQVSKGYGTNCQHILPVNLVRVVQSTNNQTGFDNFWGGEWILQRSAKPRYFLWTLSHLYPRLFLDFWKKKLNYLCKISHPIMSNRPWQSQIHLLPLIHLLTIGRIIKKALEEENRTIIVLKLFAVLMAWQKPAKPKAQGPIERPRLHKHNLSILPLLPPLTAPLNAIKPV